MTAVNSVPAVEVHAPAELETIVRKVLATAAVLEPLAVDEPTAAKLLSISGKTLSALPADRTGRFHCGRAVRYHWPTLKAFAAEMIGKRIETET